MKKILKLAFLLSLIFVTSCEDHGTIVNCKECDAEEPVTAEIEIKTDIENRGSVLTIYIYEGNIEDGVIYKTIDAGGTRSFSEVTLNKKYTFSVSYITPEGTFTAIDSATPRVSYNKDQCNDPCYYVYDKVIDLRLKYTK